MARNFRKIIVRIGDRSSATSFNTHGLRSSRPCDLLGFRSFRSSLILGQYCFVSLSVNQNSMKASRALEVDTDEPGILLTAYLFGLHQ